MKGLLTVARREIAERRMLFVGAAVAAAAPFFVTWTHGLHGLDAAEARSATALACSAIFLYGVSAFLGGTRLPRAIAERRIGFDFARPLSSGAIWGGTLLGTFVLAIGSALIAWLPAALAGDVGFLPGLFTSLFNYTEIPWPWPVLALAASLFLFALFQAAGVAIRARSALLIVDLLLLGGALLGAAKGLIRLVWAGPSVDTQVRAVLLLVLVGLIALLLAGWAAVARGRTDLRAAHAAQSLVLWTTTFAGILGLYAYGWWLFSAPPRQLVKIRTVQPALRGSWVYAQGTARGAEAAFLYDTAAGRSVRVPWGVTEPTFSENGSVAGWLQRLGKTADLRIVDLAKKRPSSQTLLSLSEEAAGLVFDATGSRVGVIDNDGISVYDVLTGRLLVSARISPYSSFPRAFFVSPDRLRVYWFPSTTENTRLDIFELEVPAKRLVRTGTIAGLVGWPLITTDAAGRRLGCLEFEPRRVRLFDARSGEFVAPISEAETFSGAFRFLSDSRIVAVRRRGADRVLVVFSPNGAALREIPFPGGPLEPGQARSTAIGGEPSPGHLLVATGDPGDQTTYEISIEDGRVRTLARHLRPVSRYLGFFGNTNAMSPPGEPAATLFQTDDEALVRLDPTTGKQTLILGKSAR